MTIYFVFLYQSGCTPLHSAVIGIHDEVTQVLIDAGARINIPNNVNMIKQPTNVYNNVNIYCLCTTH